MVGEDKFVTFNGSNFPSKGLKLQLEEKSYNMGEKERKKLYTGNVGYNSIDINLKVLIAVS